MVVVPLGQPVAGQTAAPLHKNKASSKASSRMWLGLEASLYEHQKKHVSLIFLRFVGPWAAQVADLIAAFLGWTTAAQIA